MKSDQDRILARVRKLLALATDAGATEGERDNAMRMAHATLAKYNLDMAQVEASGQRVEGEQRTEISQAFYGRPWARLVCDSVAKLFFCKYLFIVATKAKHTHHIFFGRHSNAITASEVAKFVVLSIMREAGKRQRENFGDNAWKRSFCTGAALRISQRVEEIQRAAEKADVALGSPGKAVALATVYQQEEEANNQFVEESLGRKPKQRGGGSKNFIGNAAREGAEFGDTINLNRQVTGTKVTPVLQLEQKR